MLFDGKVEEPKNFYTSVFKNSKVEDAARNDDAGPVFSATIEIDGGRFHLLTPDRQLISRRQSLYIVNCETQAEVDELWEKLVAGGALLHVRLAEGQVPGLLGRSSRRRCYD